MSPDIRSRVRECLARAFRIELAALPRNADVETVEAWDSLGHLALYEVLKEQFPGRISYAAFRDVLSEDQLVEYLERD